MKRILMNLLVFLILWTCLLGLSSLGFALLSSAVRAILMGGAQ